MTTDYLKFSSAGINKISNEDAAEIYEYDDGLLAILCDGIGGDKSSDLSSKIALTAAYNFFISSDNSDFLARLRYAIEEANSFLLSYVAGNSEIKTLTTTLDILYIKDSFAYWGHVGDSRIYHIKAGRLKQLTKDHSLVQKLLDEGFLTQKQAENHPNKNIIMKALGDNPTVEPDISQLKLVQFQSEIIFMCSDGVSNLISNNELEQILNKESIKEMEGEIKDLCRKRGAFDDYSFIIIRKN